MITNRKIVVASILIVIVMILISFLNRHYTNQNTSIKLNNNIRIIPTFQYKLDVKKIDTNDIVVKIRTSEELKQSNKSIALDAKVVKVLQGNIDAKKISIYDKNTYYTDNINIQDISIYSNNILLPNKEYYVILEKLPKKFFYMENNSYRLKDDLSVFDSNFDSNYILAYENKNYTLKEVKNILYIFTDKDQIKEYLSRKYVLKNCKISY
ncbi:hypothetical protein [Clostridium kluyveri]|uniref:Uncharacterized protein n=1 Tax=Clostridium kluyveri TaxID=1534 RepID=A0A1L5FCU6_CLOKL|nr:hypothetical protein [Clostridium kluyveri]APM40797.1 hypothetical protein BS101_19830 [Clostridium kluyveri]